MVRRDIEEKPEWEGSNRTLVLITAIMLILLTFFISWTVKANYDESKHQQVFESLQETFGFLPGGPRAIGEESGHSLDILGGEDGQLVAPDQEMARIRALLSPAVMDREATIIHAAGRKIVSLSAGLLFAPDETAVRPDMEETLMAFSRIMAENDVPIAVEGHTDNQPPQTRGVGDNWDISAGRALAVLDFLVERGGLAPQRLTARGYAGVKPHYSNATPSGRARNNRIDLVLDFEKASAERLSTLSEQAVSWDFRGFEFLIRGEEAAGENR